MKGKDEKKEQSPPSVFDENRKRDQHRSARALHAQTNTGKSKPSSCSTRESG